MQNSTQPLQTPAIAPKSQIAQRYHSGLASLIDALWDLSKDRIQALPAKDLNLLESCCQVAQISLNGIAAAASIAFYNMDEDERKDNGIDTRTFDFAITNAETNELLYALSHEFVFFADKKQKCEIEILI